MKKVLSLVLVLLGVGMVAANPPMTFQSQNFQLFVEPTNQVFTQTFTVPTPVFAQPVFVPQPTFFAQPTVVFGSRAFASTVVTVPTVQAFSSTVVRSGFRTPVRNFFFGRRGSVVRTRTVVR